MSNPQTLQKLRALLDRVSRRAQEPRDGRASELSSRAADKSRAAEPKRTDVQVGTIASPAFTPGVATVPAREPIPPPRALSEPPPGLAARARTSPPVAAPPASVPAAPVAAVPVPAMPVAAAPPPVVPVVTSAGRAPDPSSLSDIFWDDGGPGSAPKASTPPAVAPIPPGTTPRPSTPAPNEVAARADIPAAPESRERPAGSSDALWEAAHGSLTPASQKPEPVAAAPEVTIEATEQLTEDDFLEMSSDVLESVPPSGEVSEELPLPEGARWVTQAPPADLHEEQPPSSSHRPKGPGTLDEAVAQAEAEAVAIQEGREVPLKTPPPESGPQEAPIPAGLAASAPVFDELLEPAPLAPPFPGLDAGPTPEQVGETIEFPEASRVSLELDAPLASGYPAHDDGEAVAQIGIEQRGLEQGRLEDILDVPEPPPDERQSGEIPAAAAAYAAEPPEKETLIRPHVAHAVVSQHFRAPEQPTDPRTMLAWLDASIGLMSD
ncbi:MAG TPA: hypothetical protein VFQ61_26550 [Polyangiaceae bacterium]|nr:hypothetical protein [Polyangiaceae bacterium]